MGVSLWEGLFCMIIRFSGGWFGGDGFPEIRFIYFLQLRHLGASA